MNFFKNIFCFSLGKITTFKFLPMAISFFMALFCMNVFAGTDGTCEMGVFSKAFEEKLRTDASDREALERVAKNENVEKEIRVKAALDLGDMYKKGEGGRQDFAQAVRWYSFAAEGGKKEAIGALVGLVKNAREDAREALERVAKNENVEKEIRLRAALDLGEIYAKGSGIMRDFDEAVRWYETSAEYGNTDAIVSLETRIEVHESHVLVEALVRLARTEKEGAREALERLAKNEKLAVWTRLDIARYLGKIYSYGEGAPKDMEKASEWEEFGNRLLWER